MKPSSPLSRWTRMVVDFGPHKMYIIWVRRSMEEDYQVTQVLNWVEKKRPLKRLGEQNVGYTFTALPY